MKTKTLVIATSLAACLSVPANANEMGTNLVVNGDAEIGTMDGWTPTNQVEIATTKVSGHLGLPPGVEIGQFCLDGGSGPLVQACSQSISLIAHAPVIDAGLLICTMTGVLQSRTTGGDHADTVECTFEFQHSKGTLQTVTFEDDAIEPGIYDWSPFSLGMVVPAGTRSVLVTLTMERTDGISTDAYADNISFVLTILPCPADLDEDNTVGMDDFLILLAFWGPCDVVCLGDLDGDGVVGINDFLQLLAEWGPCP